MDKTKPRGLDGFYLRVKRGDKYVNRCFTDLTTEEQEKWLARLSDEGLRRMVLAFAEIIRTMGDQFGIVGDVSEDD